MHNHAQSCTKCIIFDTDKVSKVSNDTENMIPDGVNVLFVFIKQIYALFNCIREKFVILFDYNQ